MRETWRWNEGKPESEPFNAGHHPLHPSFLYLSQESCAAKSLGAGDSLACVTVIHGAEAPWLDSCDKRRNEGGSGGRRIPSKARHA
ncbi:hypothetical protein NXC12_CH00228 [Rhizobium etli]|uniref:Uncharacterized protein n=1 Tax=Rhizobium etli TaxID=29449 RepID=A0AAN1BDD6_RHIET|nr:hypothetical protein NXC12_CH00228 [Rhizobium etli]